MNIDKDKETEMKTGMDMAALAERKDDERQQAEAEAAQKMLQQMQNKTSDTSAKDDAAKAQAEDDERRRAHEESEAKRKAEWEEKQRKTKRKIPFFLRNPVLYVCIPELQV